MDYKLCPRCKTSKPSNDFNANRQCSDGLCSYCKDCSRAYRRERRQNKQGYAYEERLRRNRLRKKKILDYYGKQCARCGFEDIRALSVDHIDGKGSLHRKTVSSFKLYQWLIENDFPDGFQILCMNCQFIKRHENHEFVKL